jgi:mycothiol system anti-sigma-R factor
MSCELTGTVLHGYLDGELDAARAADFEEHLVSCPDCVRELEAQENLRSSLQSAALYERAPSALRQKLHAELSAPAPVHRSPIIFRPNPWRWLAVAAALFLAAFAGWRLVPGLSNNGGETTLAAAIVDAHLRSLQPGHLEDVISTDQHTVKPWFDGKLDFAPPVHDFADSGFPLQGGRLDVVGGRTVAVLVYARRKHIINVFVWPTSEPNSQPAFGSQLGYNWLEWRKNGMELYAVSDVNSADLGELQRLFE